MAQALGGSSILIGTSLPFHVAHIIGLNARAYEDATLEATITHVESLRPRSTTKYLLDVLRFERDERAAKAVA